MTEASVETDGASRMRYRCPGQSAVQRRSRLLWHGPGAGGCEEEGCLGSRQTEDGLQSHDGRRRATAPQGDRLQG